MSEPLASFKATDFIDPYWANLHRRQVVSEVGAEVERLREALTLARDRLAFIEPRRQDADSVRRADRALNEADR